jgi:hypothetical protein
MGREEEVRVVGGDAVEGKGEGAVGDEGAGKGSGIDASGKEVGRAVGEGDETTEGTELVTRSK